MKNEGFGYHKRQGVTQMYCFLSPPHGDLHQNQGRQKKRHQQQTEQASRGQREGNSVPLPTGTHWQSSACPPAKVCYPEIAMATPRRSQEVRPARQPCVEGREKGESQGRALKKVLARMAPMCWAGKITDRRWEALAWALVWTLCTV